MPNDKIIRQDDRLEEVNYAILKSIAYDFKTNREITKALKIRNVVVERHLYKLIKDGFIKYMQYAVLTSSGNDHIRDFETNKPENVWRPIDEYILSVREYNKEMRQRRINLIDTVLLIAMVFLIILILYFIIYY